MSSIYNQFFLINIVINQQEHIICKDFSKDFLTALLVFVMRLDFFEFFIVIIMKTIIRE